MTTAERFNLDGPRRRRVLAASFAVTSHGMLLLGLSRLHGTTPRQATTSIAVEITTRLVQPPALRPEAKAEGHGVQHARAQRRAAPRQAQPRTQTQARAQTPPPVIDAPEVPSDVPLDLTGETPMMATGGAAEGATGARAPGSGALAGDGAGATVAGGGAKQRDGSRPVTLGGQSWSCPWPAEADAEGIDERTVVLRVVVATDGAVEAAEILDEPGHGFGRAALACAWKTRFAPARDREGRPVGALSPPIRVRFTR